VNSPESELDELRRLNDALDQHLLKMDSRTQSEIEKALATEAVAQSQPQNEFVKLVDFIQKEQQRRSSIQKPEALNRKLRLVKYLDVKDKAFEQGLKQKGVQVNKAA